MDAPNDQLRRARERLPSHQTPGACLSRQEVADLANAWIFATTKKRVDLDANYVGKLERGVIRWPGRIYREALRAVLHAEADVQLGFYVTRRRSGSVGEVERQQFFRLAGAVLAMPLLELFTPIQQPTPVPARVGRTEIDQVHAAVTVFASWDNSYGGGLARETVFAQLRWSAHLLRAHTTTKLQPELFAAVAQLANVAAFMAFDAYAHDDARRCFRFALSCAEHADDWQLRAGILADMARQTIWCGDPDGGLTMVETAMVRADRLTATERAALHTLRARALAKLHRTQPALSAVGAADDAFTHTEPANDPPWMAYYDHAQHHGDTGHALYDLSMSGKLTQAAVRLAYSVAHHGQSYLRSRTMSLIKLASLLTVTGDPRQAAAVGHQALTAATGLRSRRADDDLTTLHRLTEHHPGVSELRDLRDRITETLNAP